MSRRSNRRYDQRLKNLVAESEDISQFQCYGIPSSTIRHWKKTGYKEFISIPELSQTATKLIQDLQEPNRTIISAVSQALPNPFTE